MSEASERMSEERFEELAAVADRVIAEPQNYSASQWNFAKAVSECVREINRLRAERDRARTTLETIVSYRAGTLSDAEALIGAIVLASKALDILNGATTATLGTSLETPAL